MDEENKIIDKIDLILFQSYTSDIGIAKEDYNYIMKFIKDQQKEIEDLKAITQNYNAIGGETFGDDRIIVCSMKYFDNGYFKKNYIFKNKIREKIQEIDDKGTFDAKIVLEHLLEEN